MLTAGRAVAAAAGAVATPARATLGAANDAAPELPTNGTHDGSDGSLIFPIALTTASMAPWILSKIPEITSHAVRNGAVSQPEIFDQDDEIHSHTALIASQMSSR